MNSNKENIYHLIVAYLAHDISQADLVILTTWRNLSVQNEEEFEQIKFLWEGSQHLHLFKEVNVDDDWQKVKEKLNFDIKIRESSGRKFIFTWRRFAAALVPFAIVLSATFMYLNIPGFGRLASYESNQVIEQIVLPDNTEVTLNKNSQIIFNKNIANQSNRDVTLKGEAFFNVTHNDMPFVVYVGDAQVQVLGTAFNVNLVNEDLYVSVVRGKVSVNVSNQKIELTEGQSVVLKDGELVKESLSFNNALFWKTNKLIFSQATLTEVCEELKKVFKEVEQIKFTGKDNAVKVTTTFEKQSLNEIIDELRIHFNKKITFDGSILTISD